MLFRLNLGIKNKHNLTLFINDIGNTSREQPKQVRRNAKQLSYLVRFITKKGIIQPVLIGKLKMALNRLGANPDDKSICLREHIKLIAKRTSLFCAPRTIVFRLKIDHQIFFTFH